MDNLTWIVQSLTVCHSKGAHRPGRRTAGLAQRDYGRILKLVSAHHRLTAIFLSSGGPSNPRWPDQLLSPLFRGQQLGLDPEGRSQRKGHQGRRSMWQTLCNVCDESRLQRNCNEGINGRTSATWHPSGDVELPTASGQDDPDSWGSFESGGRECFSVTCYCHSTTTFTKERSFSATSRRTSAGRSRMA